MIMTNAHNNIPDIPSPPVTSAWRGRHLLALVIANVTLALGAWLVRLADTGPVATGLWRLTLALPVVMILAWREPATERRMKKGALLLIIAAGLFFALDLASWHIGILQTKLGNAALFGNAGSLVLMVWGLISARRMPHILELAAIIAALAGAALLMGGSLDISPKNLVGDLLCLTAGMFYACYILMLNKARQNLGPFSVLTVSTLASIPVLLGTAMVMGEVIIPHDWTPLAALAVSSQLLGQGLLIYALRHFPPLIIGLAMMTQPAISATVGWLAFGETLGTGDMIGMVLLAAALALAKAADVPMSVLKKPASNKKA